MSFTTHLRAHLITPPSAVSCFGTQPARRACLAALLALGTMGIPTPASSQADVPHGTRVRVRHVGGRPMVGTLVGISSDSVRVRTVEAGDVALPAGSVIALDRSLGRERRFWRNFGLTAVAIAASGGILGAVTYEPCESTGFLSCLMVPESHGEAFLYGAAFGSVIGIPVGALVGYAVESERWAPVEGFGERRVSVRPIVGRRIGVSATYAVGRRPQR